MNRFISIVSAVVLAFHSSTAHASVRWSGYGVSFQLLVLCLLIWSVVPSVHAYPCDLTATQVCGSHTYVADGKESSLNSPLAGCKAKKAYKDGLLNVMVMKGSNYSFISFCRVSAPPDCTTNPNAKGCSNDHDCEGTANTGNPIVLSSGRKFLNEIDVPQVPGSLLSFERRYNYIPGNSNLIASYRDAWTFGVAGRRGNTRVGFSERNDQYLGAIYAHQPNKSAPISIDRMYTKSKQPLVLDRENQSKFVILEPNGTTTDNDVGFSASVTNDDTAANIGNINWTIKSDKGAIEKYDNAGRLVSIKEPSGYSFAVTYASTRYQNDNYSITDSNGRTLTFKWTTADNATLVGFNGEQYQYAFNDNAPEGPTLTVYYPDSTPEDLTDNDKREYIHIASFNANGSPAILNGALKEIRDNGVTVLSYGYDPVTGHAVHSHRPVGDTPVENKDITYALNADGKVTAATLVSPLNARATYYFDTINSSQKLVHVEGESTSNCAASDSFYSYDVNGYQRTETDARGYVTETVRDSRGLVTEERQGLSWSEGPGSTLLENPESRRIVTVWHAQVRKPELRTFYQLDSNGLWQPYKEDAYIYDPDNYRLIQSTITDNTPPYSARIWTFAYTYWDAAKVHPKYLVVDGPRTDVSDSSVYYFSDGSDSNHRAGDLLSITNAMGHVVLFNSYDNAGRVESITDANGVETQMTYTLRGHLESMVVKDSTGNAELDSVVQYKWYPSGALQQLTFPDGSYLHYTYNEAGHLTEIRNNIDEKITFEPNAVGDWVEARTLDASSEMKRLQVRAFDELSRLLKDISPFGEETVFGYDANGNPILRTDAANQSWQSSYDALNRLAAQIDPKAGEVKYKYDALDRLTKVTDQNDLSTDYQYDAFGNRTLQISPDTGTTDYDYDAAGNLILKTDARGVVSAYQYDALNRLVAITYPLFPEENVQYQYDLVSASSAGIGRLGRITDLSGETEYSYDARGNITSKQSLVEAQPYVVTYRYDLANRLVGLTYPSGRAVRYERDEQGRILRVQTQSSLIAPWVTLADQVLYQPFGGVSEFTYGNGLNQDVDYDLAYRLTGITTQGLGPVLNRQYQYDALDNINQINDAVTPSSSQIFVYDELSRLTDADGGYGALNYQYDAVGNRLSQSKTSGSQNLVETYSYATDSHRLQQVTEQSGNTTRTRTLQYDANGNLINDQRLDGQQLSLHYNGSNRLSEVDESTAPLASYRHNALGQRVAKVATDPAQDEHYVYDEQGQLLSVAHRADGTMTHYVYLDQQRIAMIKEPSAQAEIYYLHNDHLGNPQAVTDENRNIVWQGEYSPFGELVSETGSLKQPHRFPGQHADPETGLNYNYFRDYDPSLGRYVQSDPIGLRGGINTYGYVYQNPIRYTDPKGLAVPAAFAWCAANPACAAAAAQAARKTAQMCVEAAGIALSGWWGAASDDGESQPQNPPNIPQDPTQPPGDDWTWRGKGEPGSREGAWYNPNTGESLHDDRTHPPGKEPHVTYTDPSGNRWDNYGSGWTPQ